MTTFERNATTYEITPERCLKKAFKWLQDAEVLEGGAQTSDIRAHYATVAMAWLMLADRVEAGLPAPATEDAVDQ